MVRKLERGEIVLATDPYSGKSGKRPFAIISDSDYPFYPTGYLGVPVTTQDKQNTFQIHQSDIDWKNEPLKVRPSFVNPWSPAQVNDAGKTVLKLSDEFMDIMAEQVSIAVGSGE